MEKHLKYVDGTSDKFWQIKTNGSQFTVTYGKNGTSGTAQTKSFDSDEKCLKEAEKLLNEKIKKGYSDDGQVSIVPSNKPKTDKQTAQQELIEEWKDLIEKSKVDALLPFLKEKTKGNIELLKKEVKKAKAHYLTYKSHTEVNAKGQTSYSWKCLGSDTQQRMIKIAALAVYNKDDARGFSELFHVIYDNGDKLAQEVLDYFKPEWLNDFLLNLSQRNTWQVVPYEKLLNLEDRGLIEWNPELYALSLIHFHQNTYRKTQEGINYKKFIIESERTLTRDIPELFNYETEIANMRDYQHNKKEPNPVDCYWHRHFIYLMEHNRIDKAWLREQSLLIQTKEWNNNIKAFFRKLIDYSNPEVADWIQHQNLIFPLFHATHNAILNYAIEVCKKIFEQPEFDMPMFLDWVEPIMMKTDAKGGIKTLLMMFEKIVKAQPEFQERITQIVTDVLAVPDMDLQQRTIKLLNKYANPSDAIIRDKITMYYPQLQGNLADLLTSFVDNEALVLDFTEGVAEKYTYDPQPMFYLLDENKITMPDTWNDILFLFGKVISEKTTADTEILLNLFVTHKHLFPEDYLTQLKPYLKQLIGYGDGHYFRHLKNYLIYKLQGGTEPYKAQADQYEYSKLTKIASKQVANLDLKIRTHSTLPLVSLPTHYPHWIEPKTLVERLKAHLDAKEPINIYDLSIALSRMPREQVEAALAVCDELPNEAAQLMRFALGETASFELPEAEDLKSFYHTDGKNTKLTLHSALWALVARTHSPDGTFKQFEKTYLKDVPNIVTAFQPEIQFKERWNEWKNWQTKELERSASWWELQFSLPDFKDIPDFLFYSADVYNRGDNNYSYYMYWQEDVRFIHSLAPQNTDALSLTILKMGCTTAGEEASSLTPFLDIMQLPEFKFRHNAMWVLACSLFNEGKKSRFIAGEILIQAIQQQKIDMQAFGKIVATLISNSYAPINRFMEAISMGKDISSVYNDALFQLLDSTLAHLSFEDKVPTNFKKVIELFFDLKVKTNNSISDKTADFLENFRNNNSLKALIKQILPALSNA